MFIGCREIILMEKMSLIALNYFISCHFINNECLLLLLTIYINSGRIFICKLF